MSGRRFAAALSGAVLAAASGAFAAPGGLYVGYYQEDPLTNPEDPTMGSVYLTLPAADSGFAGSMFFTYVGCQSESLGTVSGSKAGDSLKGGWSGSVDGRAESGDFAGAWSAATGGYAGAYTVAAGKQHVSVPSCIDYWIAPKGTWELLPVDAHVPKAFGVAVAGGQARWTAPPGAVMTLVYVLDPEQAKAGRPAQWQTLLFGPGRQAADLRAARLKSGRTYVVVVSAADGSARRVAFASKTFVAP